MKPNGSSEQSLAIVSERGYATTGAYSKRCSTLMLGLLASAFTRVDFKGDLFPVSSEPSAIREIKIAQY